MTNAEREDIRRDYCKMFCKSWTYARLTAEEKLAVMEALTAFPVYGERKKQVGDQMNAIYYSFLLALGYKNSGPMNWREPKAAPKF